MRKQLYKAVLKDNRVIDILNKEIFPEYQFQQLNKYGANQTNMCYKLDMPEKNLMMVLEFKQNKVNEIISFKIKAIEHFKKVMSNGTYKFVFGMPICKRKFINFADFAKNIKQCCNDIITFADEIINFRKRIG